MTDDKIKVLGDLIEKSERVVVFTGAGISTETGVPDFRSPGGLWTKYQPIMFDDFMRSEEVRKETWRRRIGMKEELGEILPNQGHRAIAELVNRGKITHVITQNIDNLHQDSGVPAEKVVELHGNASYAKCLDCGCRYELQPIVERFKRDETLPICGQCNGIVKMAVVSFGQLMPEEEMRRAEEATLNCDLFIAIGSSLVVYPAAGFPDLAKRNGSALAILNREATDFDTIADIVLNVEIGPTLQSILGNG